MALALYFIEKLIGTIIKSSSIYQTKPWGITDQPDFLNQAICVETQLSPFKILDKIHWIEKKIGRKRVKKWGPRKIDIDILFIDQLVIADKKLSVPHPHIQERKFVLEPLNEIAPDFIHPILLKPIKELFSNSEDSLEVSIMNG